MFQMRQSEQLAAQSWEGRWWSARGAIRLVPVGDAVLVTSPDDTKPFTDADDIEVSSEIDGRHVTPSAGYENLASQWCGRSEAGRQSVQAQAGDEFPQEQAFVERQSSLAS